MIISLCGGLWGCHKPVLGIAYFSNDENSVDSFLNRFPEKDHKPVFLIIELSSTSSLFKVSLLCREIFVCFGRFNIVLKPLTQHYCLLVRTVTVLVLCIHRNKLQWGCCPAFLGCISLRRSCPFTDGIWSVLTSRTLQFCFHFSDYMLCNAIFQHALPILADRNLASESLFCVESKFLHNMPSCIKRDAGLLTCRCGSSQLFCTS